jgi:serine/threonine-protein kinase
MAMRSIGRYEIVGRIAISGDHELVLGREATGRFVAIKRIPRDSGRGSTARHPNLVEIVELVQIESDIYLVMEYLEGENLAGLIRRLIKRKERISFGLAAHMIAEVCDGLHAAHMAGELHRALCPDTVFITYGGDVKVLELGVAVIDPDSLYRSPEQAGNRPLGRQSDVYAIGLVLYELTTLRRLFGTPADMERPIPAPSTQVPDYPQALEAIAMRALARDPADRYRSAQEMRDALLEVAAALHVEADPAQSLASKLVRLFGERVATKRELLDKLRAGARLDDRVPAEVDEDIEVPAVRRGAYIPDEDDIGTDPKRATGPVEYRDPDEDVRTDPAPAPGAPDAPTTPRLGRVTHGFRWGVALLVVLAIAGGGAAGGYLRLREMAAPPAAADAAPVPVDAPGPDAPKLPDFVTISIDTEPSSAKVLVDGEERGITPVDLRVPGGAKPLSIELRRDGYKMLAREVVPDRDRTLKEKLQR